MSEMTSERRMCTIRYRLGMPPEGNAPSWTRVVSRREARLLFWLVVIALFGVIITLYADVRDLRRPGRDPLRRLAAVLRSRTLVSFLQRHLPFRGRGVSVAITYVVTAIVAFVVIAAAAVAVINAAVVH
jgi:hypothetical protein